MDVREAVCKNCLFGTRIRGHHCGGNDRKDILTMASSTNDHKYSVLYILCTVLYIEYSVF